MMLNRKQCLCYTWCHRKYIAAFNHKRIHQSCILQLRKPSSAKKTINSLSNTSKMTDSNLFQTQKAVSYGNTNFYGVEGDVGVIYTDAIPKRQQLIQDSIKNLQSKPKCEFKTVSFGAVRLDSENMPTYYARYSTGVERSELVDENENFEKELSENTSKSVSAFMTNKTLEIDDDNVTDNVKYMSSTEDLPSSLSDIEKKISIDHVFHEAKEFKPETSLSNVSGSSSETKLNSSTTFEKNQTELYDKQKSNFIDNFYFASVKDSGNTTRNEKNEFESENDFFSKSQSESQQINSAEKSSNYIDEQYFPEAMVKDLPAKHSQNADNYIDEQYFSNIDSITRTTKTNKSDFVINTSNSDLNLKYDNTASHVDKPDFSEKNSEIQNMHILSDKICESNKPISSHFQLSSDTNEKLEIIKKNELSISDSMPNNVDKNENYSLKSEKKITKSASHPSKTSGFGTELQGSTSASKIQTETAYDFVKKLREKQTFSDEVKKGISAKKEKKVDSKGFRILKHQVPSLMYFTRDEMLELLKKNILYMDEDIVVLNKPYNLVIHESNSTKNKSCLSSYLSDFAQLIGERNQSQELFTIHRLDKETTGCLLLARNKEAAQKMKSLFAQRKIIKTYWIVTSKVPDPLEGVIDIPISEGKIGEKTRMVLHPDLPTDTPYVNHSKCGKRAVTYYTVIATSGNAALVEVKPETGIKHQIRVHFGFGLACPILGDHKYSYLDKLVPQKLPSDLLQRLHVRQSKVRHIPLHIHSKHLLIPQYANQRNLYVSAPLPHHMSENLRFLKFKK